MKKLRIAQIATPWFKVPPRKYGGTELVISLLTEELVKRGHQVTLFASGDSETKAKLISVCPRGLRQMNISWFNIFYPLWHVIRALERAKEFDIIHNHVGHWGFAFSRIIDAPILTTIHEDFSAFKNQPGKYKIWQEFRRSSFVSISKSQRRSSLIKLNFMASIYNGIDVKAFNFNTKPKNYNAWLGRLKKRKGILEAINFARRHHLKLWIGARVDPIDKEFYESIVRPLINDKDIKFLGELNHKEKVDLLRNAKGLLYPLQWEEPFGLVMVEAMACGTPVIATRRGSVPEVVKDKKTGFIINPRDLTLGMKKAVRNIDRISRVECRKHVERNFSKEKMVEEYEKVYEKIISRRKKF